MAGMPSIGFGTNGGRDQIINGKTYSMYSPQWYDAMRQNKITNAETAGTAAGSGARAALNALGQVVNGGSNNPSGGAPMTTSPSVPRIGEPGDGGSGGSGGYSGGDTPIPQISAPDLSKANSAAYASAKDKVGLETQGGLTGLRSALASRGMLGSGAESRGTMGVITKGQGELGETDRALAQHEADVNLDVAKTNLGANLTGRGQDITRRGQSMDFDLGKRGQDVTQRGQDIQQQEANAQMQLTKSLQEAAQRQAILQGIMGAIGGSTLY